MQQSQHYWRINARVARRIWGDMARHIRAIIAADHLHEREETKWFNKTVAEDSQKLFEDPNYYDNQPHTFTYLPAKWETEMVMQQR